METLETRQLLAADFIVNAPDRDVRIEMVGEQIWVIDRADGQVIRREKVDDIDSRRVQITSASTFVGGTLDLNGNSLQVESQSIVLDGGVIRTAHVDASGNSMAQSGDISLAASEIVISNGAGLNTMPVGSNSYAPGKITLTAVDRSTSLWNSVPVIPALYENRSPTITIRDVTISGGEVQIFALGGIETSYDNLGGFSDDIASQLQSIEQLGISAISPLSGQAKVYTSSAIITLADVTIDSASDVVIQADAEADASLNAIAVNGIGSSGSTVFGSVGFGKASATAKVDLAGASQINAAGHVNILTNATTQAEVNTRADGGTRLSSDADYAFNISIAMTDEQSNIDVAEATTITSQGAIRIEALGAVKNKAKATTSLFQPESAEQTGNEAGLSVALGIDNANITATVYGTLVSGLDDLPPDAHAAGFNRNQLNAATEELTFSDIPAAVPFRVGERVVYSRNQGADVGLADQREYIVFSASEPIARGNGRAEQTIRLVAAETIELDDRQTLEASTHTLTRLGIVDFTRSEVTNEAGTNDGLLELADLPSGVDTLTYLGPDLESDPDALGVPGLEQNQAYEVVRVNARIKLRLPGQSDFVDFSAPANGRHGFYFTEHVLAFAPRTDVDNAANTIRLPAGHGLQTGDLVLYGTDPNQTIERALQNFGSGQTALGSIGSVTLPDAPVGGLQDELGYRVVVDADDPNQIRLTTSKLAATAGQLADLNSTASDGLHLLLRDLSGVTIRAYLDAENTADAGTALSDNEQSWSEVAMGAAQGNVDQLISGGQALIGNLRQSGATKVNADGQANTGTEANTSATMEVAGSIAVSVFQHDVLATLGALAEVQSSSNLDLSAEVLQATQLKTIAETNRRGTGDSQNQGAAREISAALGVGIYDNDAQATIADGAVVNVNQHTAVTARVEYPLLVSRPGDALNPFSEFSRRGFNAFKDSLDGTLGLSQFFNVSTRTTTGGEGDQLALGGAAVVTDYTNQVVAHIGDAEVNQQVDRNQHEPSLTVSADLSAELLEVGQIASMSLDLKGFAEAWEQSTTADPRDFLGQLGSPFGLEGDNAIGGVFLVTLADNRTTAYIDSGAAVSADQLSVQSASDFYNLAVVQTGTSATDFGFSAAVAASNIQSKTTASIRDGAVIAAGNLQLSATDDLDRVNIVGAFLKGKQAGIGTSIGVNVIDQQVAAYIGREDRETSLQDQTQVNVGIASIDATADGDVFSLVVSGGLQGLGTSSSRAEAKQIGAISLNVPVAVNNVISRTEAYADGLTDRITTLDVSATSEIDVQAIVVGASFAVQARGSAVPGKLNLAGSGAVAVNTVLSDVHASVTRSGLLNVQGLTVKATDRSKVEADAGGVAIVASLSPQTRAALSFGVSVAINDVRGNIEAYVDDSWLASQAGNYEIAAESLSITRALAIAGGAAASGGNGSFGGAGAAAQNAVAKHISAEVSGNSTLRLFEGRLVVRSRDDSQIVADAGGVGIGVTAGPGASIGGAVGIGLAFNDVANVVTAAIDSSTVEAGITSDRRGPIEVQAATNTTIKALAVAASAGVAGSAGLSAALAGAGVGAENEIANQVIATISDSTVSSGFIGNDIQSAGILVLASDTSEIIADSIGASLALTGGGGTAASVVVGISVAHNAIANHTTASVIGSNLNSDAGIAVTSDQLASITATTVAASAGVAGGNVAVGVVGAGASANNEISNQTIALVQDSQLVAAGDISVLATDESLIDATIVAASIALAGGNVGVAAAFGFSFASNRIGDATTYQDDPLAERGSGSARVMAVLHSSAVTTPENIHVYAQTTGSSTTHLTAASMAAAAGNVGAAVAGAGASTSNDVEMEVISAILDGAEVDAAGETVLEVRPELDVQSVVEAATLVIAAGAYAGGVSVAVSDAKANQGSKYQTLVRRSKVQSAARTRMNITDSNDVIALAQASAVAVAAAPGGVSVAGGGVSANSDYRLQVIAEVTDSELTGGSLLQNIVSLGNPVAKTESVSIAAGLIGIGASGSSATATSDPMLTISLSGNDIDVDDIYIYTGESAEPIADAAGLTVSTGLAVGVSHAHSQTLGTTTVLIDSSVHELMANNFNIQVFNSALRKADEDPANQSHAATRANAQGSAGGLLIGATATKSLITSTRTTTIQLADQSRMRLAGDFNITSLAGGSNLAEASSLAAGLVAAGITESSVDVNVAVEVNIGDNVDIDAETILLRARPGTSAQAHSQAGAAGGISGAVATSTSHIANSSKVVIGNGSRLNATEEVRVVTATNSILNASLVAASGGFLSGAGAVLSNTLNASSNILIGDATITARNLDLDASNTVEKLSPRSSGTFDATTGGLIAGVGVVSTTDLNLASDIQLGGRLEIDNASQNHARISAANYIDAVEQTTLRSGGVAAGGSNRSTIRTPTNTAAIRFVDGAMVTASGGIDIYAGGGGDIEIQSNSETFGAATVGAGVATISVTPRNRVTLESGSEIVADRDVNLSAGTDASFNQDEYNIRARVDTFAGSLIPIDLMDAVATLDQDNRITINSGAAVRSGGDLRLHAEQFADNDVIAQVKAVNWATGVAGAIDGIFAAGGVEQFGGTASVKASGIVTVDGIAETGIARNRILEITEIERADPGLDEDGNPLPETIELFTVHLDPRSTGDVTFEKRLLPVNSALDLALAEAERQLELYRDNSQLRDFYLAEVTRLKAELEEQGLLQTLVDESGRSRQQRVVRQTLSLDVDPIFAKAGRIDVRADSFGRNGQVIAPGDSTVEIVNQTPANLILRGIEVTEDAGGVFWNGQWIGGGEGSSTGKHIIVDNRFVLTSDNTAYSWPNITVSGPVSNLGGNILLRTRPTGGGSITVNAPVNGRTQQIIAGNNGTVIINLPELGSIYEAGGAEHERWGWFTRPRLLGLPIGEPGTGQAEPDLFLTEDGLFFGDNPSVTSYLSASYTTPSLIGSSIFISAQYINVNGIIQSGKPEYKLTITEETAAEIDSLRGNSSLQGLIDLDTVDSSDLLARYDVERDLIVVEELRVSGGYVDLTGHITNTHNGEIRVLSDYSKIHIDNQTEIDIEVKRLDVSRRGEGTVIIKDLSEATREQPRVSIYRREGDVIMAETSQGVQTVPNGSSFTYLPQNGLRYGWTIAEEELERTTVETGSSRWLGMDWIAPDPDDVISTRTQQIGTPVITDAGPYFFVNANESRRYSYDRLESEISERSYTCCGWSETNWIGTTTYYNTFITERGTRTLHTHTIEADRPIDIRFEGHSSGEILIESAGNVFIAGALINPGGSTTILSDGAILQGSSEGVVGGLKVQFGSLDQRLSSVGSLEAPLQINVDESNPFDFRSDHSDSETTINHGTRVEVAPGHVRGGDVGSVYRYLGERIELDLTSVDYSEQTQWSKIELGSEVEIGYASRIHLYEIAGDLPIDFISGLQVELTAQGSIVPAQSVFRGIVVGGTTRLVAEMGSIGGATEENGSQAPRLWLNSSSLTAEAAHDVNIAGLTDLTLDRITAGGDVRIDIERGILLDGNLNDIRDDRAIEEIVTNVWDDLQLTEARGSSSKRSERVEALIASQTQSYNAYWNFRKTQADPSLYDPDHQVRLSPAERDFYDYDQEIITTIENSRTIQYHTLHATWGALGNQRIENFRHEPTLEELAEIEATMKVWTDEELLNLRSLEFLNVTDTEFVIEQPNIIARSVILNVDDGIGHYDNGSTVDLREVDGQPPILTLDQQALITAAEPGDIVYLAQEPNNVIAWVSTSPTSADPRKNIIRSNFDWPSLGFEVGQRIFLETNSRDTTDAGYFFRIEEIDGQVMTLDLSDYEFDTLEYYTGGIFIAPVFEGEDTREAPFLRVLRREDVDLHASERVVAESQRHIFLGSEQGLPIDRVHAGMGQRVQIKTAGAIYPSTDDPDAVNIVGGRIVLESAEESIGTLENPLRIDSTGDGYLIARAEKELAITERSQGSSNADLRLNQVFSETAAIQLVADGAIIDAFNSDAVSIRGAEIILRAGAGIGFANNPLEIDLIGNGPLTATASGDIQIVEVAGNLNVRHVLSQTGDVFLTADVSILDAVDVQDPYDPFSPDAEDSIASLPVADVVGRNIELTAMLGSIGAAGNELDIDTKFNSNDEVGTLTSTSGLHTYINETAGDLTLNVIRTDEETAFLAAPTGGIFNGLANFESNISGGKMWLFARDDIGQSDSWLWTAVNHLEALSTTGSMYLGVNAPISVGGVVDSAANGEDEGEAGASRFGDGLRVAGELLVYSRDSIEILENMTAEGPIRLRVSQQLTLPAGVRLQAGERIEINTPFPRGAFNVEIFGSLDAPISNIRGSDEDDILNVQPDQLTGQLSIFGRSGDDTITGSRFAESIFGGEGKDTIDAGPGADRIEGGAGFDTILNAEAEDTVGVMELQIRPIDEDQVPEVAIGEVQWILLDPEDTVALQLIDGGDLFYLDGGQLKLLPDANLQAKDDYSREITIEAVHAQGGITRGTFEILITADNDAPLAVRLNTADSAPNYAPEDPYSFSGGITERISGGAIGRVQVFDLEGDSAFEMSLSDPRFQINAGLLELKPGEFLRAEEADGFNVNLELLVTDANDAANHVVLPLAVRVFVNPTPWQNSANPLDVNHDGFVSPLDALIIINQINLGGSEYVDPRGALAEARPFDVQNRFLDVSGDDYLSPLDVLLVVNELNLRGAGEGEQTPALVMSTRERHVPPVNFRRPDQRLRERFPVLPWSDRVDEFFSSPEAKA